MHSILKKYMLSLWDREEMISFLSVIIIPAMSSRSVFFTPSNSSLICTNWSCLGTLLNDGRFFFCLKKNWSNFFCFSVYFSPFLHRRRNRKKKKELGAKWKWVFVNRITGENKIFRGGSNKFDLEEAVGPRKWPKNIWLFGPWKEWRLLTTAVSSHGCKNLQVTNEWLSALE